MVTASSPAARRLTARAISPTEPMASTTPKPAASEGSMRPMGIGRPRVRLMIASMSRSYHMLMAPEAPAPTAMQSTATAASKGCRWPGAATMPAMPEKTTSDITRGFRSCRKSATRAPSAVVAKSADRFVTVSLNASDPRHYCLFDHRQLVIAVEGRRRAHRPLQGRRPLAPVIGSHLPAGEDRVEGDEDEPDRPGIGDEGTDRGDLVPAGKGVRVVRDAARH